MAITAAEQQNIVNAVLSSIRTSSWTITQLSTATSLSASDWFEVSGGRKVAFSTIENEMLNSVMRPVEEWKAELGSVTRAVEEIRQELARNVIHWSDRGKSEGVAPLNESGIVPDEYLPEVVYANALGSPEGVAPLDEESKVPEKHMPDVVYRRDKGAYNGVAPLDEKGLLSPKYLDLNVVLMPVTNRIGKPNGIAPLDDETKVPVEYLPAKEMFESEVCKWIGRPGGIAPLDESGIVLAEHLPRAVMNSIITDTIGKAEGIASLDAEAHVPMEQMALGRMMVRVDSEEEMEALIESGKWDENKIYYTVEE